MPSLQWERFVVTGKAKARIRKFLRTQQRTEYVVLGRNLLEKIFKQEGVEFSEKLLEPVIGDFQAQALEDLYANVGASLQSAKDVFNAAMPGHKARQAQEKANAATQQLTRVRSKESKSAGAPLTLRGLIPGMAVHYARCCHPIPGDPIVGIVTTGKGVTVHTADCETLESFAAMPERWIDIAWGDAHGKEAAMVGRLVLVLLNQPNALGSVTTIIGKAGGNIINFKFTHRTTDFFDILIDVEVRDIKHLNIVIAALRANNAVSSVERAKGR